MERGLAVPAVPEHGGGLRQRAAKVAGAYEEQVAAAEAMAVSWRWATPTSGFGDVEPLRLERLGCSPGRWLHRPPPPGCEHEAIGYDVLGRVVCVREYDATGAVWLERFTTWTRGAAESACWRAPLDSVGEPLPAALQALTRIRLADGLPVDAERHLPPTDSSTRERYERAGERLARVKEDSCDAAGNLVTVVKEVLYAPDGRVEGVDALGADGRRVVWRRPGRPHATRHGARSGTGRFRRQVCA